MKNDELKAKMIRCFAVETRSIYPRWKRSPKSEKMSESFVIQSVSKCNWELTPIY
jgi:hypothetical protein